jgi:carboxypeptidase Taq
VPTLYRNVNQVRLSLIRIEADETTYNLHIALRFELELALIEGRLSVAELPAAWDEVTHRLLGLETPSVMEGVLQDIHWGAGMIGYFPTYTIGNLMSAQLWTALAADLPDVEERIAAGDFAPLREWLREHIHRHGRKYTSRELLKRTTGEELRVEPLLAYLEGKLLDAGLLNAPVRS